VTGTTNIGAFSTKRSTWPRCGGCRSCSCARTTGTWSTTPIGDVIPVALPAADRAAAYGLARIVVDGKRRVRGPAGGRRRGRCGPGRCRAEPDRGADLPAQRVTRPRTGPRTGPRRKSRDGASGTRCCSPGPRSRPTARPRRSSTRSTRGSRATWPSWPDRCWPARSPTRPGPGPTCGAMGAGNGGTDLPAGRRRRAGPGDGPGRPGSCCSARTSAPAGCSRPPGGAAGAVRGGPVWDTPISEQAIAGAAMGAAMAGCGRSPRSCSPTSTRPAGTRWPNEIAKVRYMTGGQVSLPLVLRGANGSGGLGFR